MNKTVLIAHTWLVGWFVITEHQWLLIGGAFFFFVIGLLESRAYEIKKKLASTDGSTDGGSK